MEQGFAYRPNIWRYRDYVVDSFNDDKPYPQFVREQLAGDEMPGDNPGTPHGHRLPAARHLRIQPARRPLALGRHHERDDRCRRRRFLGMGMACARCHDHKFDPILQKDYFKLRAFFEPIEWRDDLPAATDEEKARLRGRQAEWEAATKEIRGKSTRC
jgi:hypothetical protein